MERPSKRARFHDDSRIDGEGDDDKIGPDREPVSRRLPSSLTRSISPVTRKRPPKESEATNSAIAAQPTVISSPFQLTAIRDLPAEYNRDTVSLKDILGDPLISECWEFNYLHDVDFLMSAFDEDVKHLVQVHIVHGFWKQEDPNRQHLQLQASPYKNVSLHAAFMPEMFGTHHSKMLILLRHDDTAQVIIHTANMIPRDWANMTQAVWRSPLLPLRRRDDQPRSDEPAPLGCGERFKKDLLNYLWSYDKRRATCKPLIERLTRYDFSAVRAALIASVPGRHSVRGDDDETLWGWAAVQRALRKVHVAEGKSDIVIQISSIATLGPTDSWLQKTLFKALGSHAGPAGTEPGYKVVFPTPDEIRRSLDGYASGASIHTKIQSPQQRKQLQYLKPLFCHWANDCPRGTKLPDDAAILDAGRKRAAPHVKTYVRYSQSCIDWALVTSANLSKQAWGDATNSTGEMRIASYEIGVLVWPSLYAEEAKMVPTFLTDRPNADHVLGGSRPIVGFRMPYNLPLQPYGRDEVPWVATADYTEPDWRGCVWES